MKKLCLSLTLAIVAILLIIVPVLATCYAYIYVEESDGNSYEELPLICSCNITTLVESGFISSTGLDTRVLTGDGATLPHMLANDKILFVSDLAAYEDKTLIFYPGASSLSSFPIIVGYNGSITTDDDPDLELGYVLELLASGYFDASAGSGKNIVYKEGALKAYISAGDTITVAALNASEDVQWDLEYDEFDSGTHILYVVANGLGAYLYVDDLDVAKDTANLFETDTVQSHSGKDVSAGRCFYAAGRYWIIYYYDSTHFRYVTSTDGISWSSETEIDIADIAGGEEIGSSSYWDAKFRDGYLHITYASDYADNSDRLRYRRGEPQSDGSISWSAAWQIAMAYGTTSGYAFKNNYIAIDSDGYPTIAFGWMKNYSIRQYIVSSSSNDGTFSSTGEWEAFGTDHIILDLAHFPSSNELAIIARDTDEQETRFRYYNGTSWGADEEPPVGDFNFLYGERSMTADDDGNLYVGWGATTNLLAIRYATGTWQRVTLGTVSSQSYGGVKLCYNENNGVVYLLYVSTGGTNYAVGCTLNTNTMELGAPVIITTLVGTDVCATPPYGDHIGFLMAYSGNTYHTYIDLTTYDWNDNSNDWIWMQNNVMSYADYIMLGVDGDLILTYQPNTIIQGTTLPDEEGDHDGMITWGSNPSGVDVSHSELMCGEEEGDTGYYYFEPGSQDIIKPEPEIIIGDVDLESLHSNPLYPLVQVLSIDGFLNERLVWLGLAWLIVIVAMLGVHLGFDTRKNTEKPQHFILTTITGLGLSILFYSWGIFPLWVIILMSFGLVGSIIWERQPVM